MQICCSTNISYYYQLSRYVKASVRDVYNWNGFENTRHHALADFENSYREKTGHHTLNTLSDFLVVLNRNPHRNTCLVARGRENNMCSKFQMFDILRLDLITV